MKFLSNNVAIFPILLQSDSYKWTRIGFLEEKPSFILKLFTWYKTIGMVQEMETGKTLICHNSLSSPSIRINVTDT